MIHDTIRRWHAWLETQSTECLAPEGLDELLADDVTFHSPVVHTPQRGKDLTKMYLTGAGLVLGPGNFRYVREIFDGENAVLEFTAEVDGIHINGVDMIRCNGRGEIVDFKVMVRPLKAINLLHQKMGEMLQTLAAK